MEFDVSRRGLNREGAYLKFWRRREELIREGVNRAFTVEVSSYPSSGLRGEK